MLSIYSFVLFFLNVWKLEVKLDGIMFLAPEHRN